jgi:hypothetical protein
MLSMLLSRPVGASFGLLLVVEGASPLLLTVAGVDELAVLLGGFGFALDRIAAAGAADA